MKIPLGRHYHQFIGGNLNSEKLNTLSGFLIQACVLSVTQSGHNRIFLCSCLFLKTSLVIACLIRTLILLLQLVGQKEHHGDCKTGKKLSIMLSFMAKGYRTFPIEIKVEIKQMHGLQYYFSSIIGNVGKTKADFELSPCSVETYYFKVRMSQPKRGHS